MSAPTPGRGKVAELGIVVVTPGSGAMRIIPVSVCHQVSTIGQRSPPIVRWYHIQASGLIGSPTVPKRRRLDMSYCLGHLSPHFINARIAVGAVYKMFTRYFWTIDQKRPSSGQLGAPSYMMEVA